MSVATLLSQPVTLNLLVSFEENKHECFRQVPAANSNQSTLLNGIQPDGIILLSN